MQTETPSSAQAVTGANRTRIRISKGERAICIAGGALLLSSGISDIKNSPVTAFAKALAGGYLLYRGASGHCPLKEFIGRTMAQMSSAPSQDIEEEAAAGPAGEPAANEGTTDTPYNPSPDEDRPAVAHG